MPGWFRELGPRPTTVQQMANLFLPPQQPQQPFPQSSAAGSSGVSPMDNEDERRWPFAIVPSVVLTNEDRPPVVPSMPLYNTMQDAPPAAPQPMTPISPTIQPPYAALTVNQIDILNRLSRVEELRCLNVRQPWASLLTENLKTVENRSPGANRPHFTTYSNIGDNLQGEWVLIVASTARPTQAVLVQALQDFKGAYGDVEGQQQYDQFMARHVGHWVLGGIVGVVRFDRLLTPESVSSDQTGLTPGVLGWYHGTPDVGWHIRAGDAIAFNRPIPNIPGVLSIARISSKESEIEKRIREALRQMT